MTTRRVPLDLPNDTDILRSGLVHIRGLGRVSKRLWKMRWLTLVENALLIQHVSSNFDSSPSGPLSLLCSLNHIPYPSMYWNAFPSNRLPVLRESIWPLPVYPSNLQTGENTTSPLTMMQFSMTGRMTSIPALALAISVTPWTSFIRFISPLTISIATLVDCLLCVTGCNPHINHPPSSTIGRATSSIINGYMSSRSPLSVHHTIPAINPLALISAQTLPPRLQHVNLYLILQYTRLGVLRLHHRQYCWKDFTRSDDGINVLSVPFGAHGISCSLHAPSISANLRYVLSYPEMPQCLILLSIDILSMALPKTSASLVSNGWLMIMFPWIRLPAQKASYNCHMSLMFLNLNSSQSPLSFASRPLIIADIKYLYQIHRISNDGIALLFPAVNERVSVIHTDSSFMFMSAGTLNHMHSL